MTYGELFDTQQSECISELSRSRTQRLSAALAKLLEPQEYWIVPNEEVKMEVRLKFTGICASRDITDFTVIIPLLLI